MAQRPGWTFIEDELVKAVQASELRSRPFDHIYMQDIVSPATYESLIAQLPGRPFYHELRHRDAIRTDGHSTRLRMYLYPELLRRLPIDQRHIWASIGQALCSKKLESAFRRKFETALEARFHKPASQIGLYPVPILLRDQPGYRIGIHSDSPRKAITVQFYLPVDGRQQHLGTVFHESADPGAAELSVRMPFLPASGYAFPVSLAESWHSAATTSEADGERISMMVTYYVADSLAAKLKYRLRRTGMRFGLHPRG